MNCDHVRVGVAVILRSNNFVLMGCRKGSHGSGTWSFPGGHLEKGETVFQAAQRELQEETGIDIRLADFKKLTFTNDIFESAGKHYVTLYVEVDLGSVRTPKVQLKEPDKCAGWVWFDRCPDLPLFTPIVNLLQSGFEIWRPA